MDDVITSVTLFLNDNIRKELYDLVQNGVASQLDARLHEISDSIDYLRVIDRYDQEQLSLLMLAALNGNDDIVRILLTHYNSKEQVETKGKINISDEQCINGATALYCACYRGHFTVAKTLIELGNANVNQGTSDRRKFPLLLHATTMDRLDIVRFLIENGYSDVNKTTSGDYYNITALILASGQGSNSLIEYLIQVGADINHSSRFKTSWGTPIVVAAKAGHVESVRLLYDANADFKARDESCKDFMDIALKHNYESLLEFLFERSINTIEDFELKLSSSVDIPLTVEQMSTTFKHLKYALQYRQLKHLEKVCIEPIIAYNYEQECQTIDELNLIENNHQRIIIEIILIRERFFKSKKDMKIVETILDKYGDWLVSKAEFDTCRHVLINMFYLYQQAEKSTTLHRFVWLFCKMLTLNQIVPAQSFLQAVRLVFEPSQITEKTCTTNNALYLVIIATKILQQEETTIEEKKDICRWVNDLCRIQLATRNGETLLHLCVDSRTNDNLQYRSSDTTPHIKFPNESGLRLLLACGSRWLDLNAKENIHGNTPFHTICQKTGDRQIIELLLNAGCHIDCTNKKGIDPLSCIKDDETKNLFIKKSRPLNLKCLCAHHIANNRLKLDILGPSTSNLNKFIGMHGGLFVEPDDEDEDE